MRWHGAIRGPGLSTLPPIDPEVSSNANGPKTPRGHLPLFLPTRVAPQPVNRSTRRFDATKDATVVAL